MAKEQMASASDKAYDTILAHILDGTLRPGSFLIEKELAETIGVSRTPVRAALKRLEAEGLVHTSEYKRAVVTEFAEEDIDDLFDLRAILESYGARRAADRITAAQLARLKDLAGQMEAVTQAGGTDAPSKFSELNDTFHWAIAEASGSRRLIDMLRPVFQVQLVLMRRYRQTIDTHLHRNNWHHREIIQALELGDGDWAAEQMRTHLVAAKNPGNEARSKPAAAE